METKIYNALALLTDCAQRVLAEIDQPEKLKFNLEFLADAVASAEKILLQWNK